MALGQPIKTGTRFFIRRVKPTVVDPVIIIALLVEISSILEIKVGSFDAEFHQYVLRICSVVYLLLPLHTYLFLRRPWQPPGQQDVARWIPFGFNVALLIVMAARRTIDGNVKRWTIATVNRPGTEARCRELKLTMEFMDEISIFHNGIDTGNGGREVSVIVDGKKVSHRLEPREGEGHSGRNPRIRPRRGRTAGTAGQEQEDVKLPKFE